MPSGDNWQGDVLRDLRSGPPTTPPDQPDPPQGTPHDPTQPHQGSAPHQAPGAPHPAQPHTGPDPSYPAPAQQGPGAPHPSPATPQGPGTPHPGHAPQGPGPSYPGHAQQDPGAPHPSAAAPQGYPGHAAPHPGQAPGTPAYSYPNQAPPQAPAQAATPQGQNPAYGYPSPDQGQHAAHAADPQQGPAQAATPQGFRGTPATPHGQDPAYGYPGPDQARAQAAAHAADPQRFPHQAAAPQDPARATAPQGQAPGYGYPGPPHPQAQNPAAGPQAFPHQAAAPQGQAQAPAHAAAQHGFPGDPTRQGHAPGQPGRPQTPGHGPARQGQAPAYPDQPQGPGHAPTPHGSPGHSAGPQGDAAGYGYPGPNQPPAPAAQARRTPDSRPSVDRKVASAGRKPLHGEPFAARATRALRRIVSSSAAREVAEATRAAELLQQPVTTGRQIAVTSIRGGAGKSTVAALLGTTYAHYRQDPVLFVEADPALGSLPIRLGAESLRWTTGDIADIVEPQMSLLDITGYLVQLRDNAWLLPGSQGQIGAMLDARSYERAMVALRRYFGVTVVDCETLPAEVARVALTASQARVLTTPATLDGVMSTYAVLQWMRGLPPHVIAGTVVVLTEQSPHSGIGLAEAVSSLESIGTSVHVLPYDRHLAAGGRIRTELLAHSTRQTAARLAADVFQLSQQRH
ncbi:cobalamin biosynthesis protein CbiA [Streptomyces sp. NPDC002467]|uniref:MinD/ParA family ATP-binding protein n=1 Tax=Streptomyces sp. NPDC002467 TaxID=3364647 RepID=UPI0036BDEE7E